MSLLDKHIVKAILGPVALVMAVLMVLSGVFLFNTQQDDIGVGSYTTVGAAEFVLLNLPAQAWQLLPLATLVGSLVGLGALARGSEITVMRAAGVSPARIAGSALIAATLLVVIETTLGEFIAPPLQIASKEKKALTRFSAITLGDGTGAWVRDGSLILSTTSQFSDRQFGGMVVFELTADHTLRAIGVADRVTLGTTGSAAWVLRGYRETRFMDHRVLSPLSRERTLYSNLSAEFLGLAVTNPNDLRLVTLYRLIRYRERNALETRAFVFAFWSRISRTAAIPFAVLLAVPFVLGSLRSAGAGAKAAVGLAFGVGLFLAQRLIESGTLVFDINPILLAWLPTVLLAVLSSALLIRAQR